jgi:hypothetical protein
MRKTRGNPTPNRFPALRPISETIASQVQNRFATIVPRVVQDRMSRITAFIPAALLLLLLFRPIHDVDIFWQVAMGQRGPLVTTEPFLATKLGQPIVPAYWLGQQVLAAIHRIGDWRLLSIVDAVIWLSGFAFAARSIPQASAKASGVALVIGVVTAVAFASLRPQSFAVGLLGFMMMATAGRRVTWLIVSCGAALFILWQNLHPSVVVAVLYFGMRSAAGGILWWRGKGTAPFLDTGLTIAATAAIFATPAGFSILGLSSANAEMCAWLRVPEWMPLFAPENRRSDTAGAWLGLLSLAAVGILHRRRISARHLVPAIGFAILTIASFRFAVFLGLTLVPVVAEALHDDRDEGCRHGGLACGLMAVVACVFLFVPVTFDRSFPFQTISELKDKTGTIFTHRPWGSLLPGITTECRATHDGRMYMFDRTEWTRYLQIVQGEVPIDEIVAAIHPQAFLLRPGVDDGLIGLLNDRPDWKAIQLEASAILFLPRIP